VVQQLASGTTRPGGGQVAAVSNPGSIVLAMRKENKDLLNKTYLQAFPSAVSGQAMSGRRERDAVINRRAR